MPHPNLEPVMSSGPRPWVQDDGPRDRTRTEAAKRAAVARKLARRTKELTR